MARMRIRKPEKELLGELVEHYTAERDRVDWDKRDVCIRLREGFESEVQKLESMISGVATDRLRSQLVIDRLTAKLKNQEDSHRSTRTGYLSVLVQAFYNLDLENEFEIDISDWPEDGHYAVGRYLTGMMDKPLSLTVRGNSYSVGTGAKYSNYNLYGQVAWCGFMAEHCNFTLHSLVKDCGFEAERSTFSLLPNAKIEYYLARQPGNILRTKNDKGEWSVLVSIDLD